MKSIINKFFTGAALISTLALGSCVGDLDQLPMDPNDVQTVDLNKNVKEYFGGIMAKCYSSLAVSGQKGPDDAADIEGLDGGTSQYTRAVFMLEEFMTDECLWLYNDGGVDEMRWGTWGPANVAIFGTYSRLYTHIGVCNDFIRLTKNPGQYSITIPADVQPEIDQFVLEARALRALSYYYVIDMWGNGVYAWDDQAYGDVPYQLEGGRKELFEKVVADLEDVVANWPDNQTPVFGRLSKDGAEGLLTKFYLNGKVYTGSETLADGSNTFSKCLEHCENIIRRKDVNSNHGLAKDYLSLFCATNNLFTPTDQGIAGQQELLWYIPQNSLYTQPYGGATFLINGAMTGLGNGSWSVKDIKDEKTFAGNAFTPQEGYMDITWYGTSDGWGCMYARPEFANLYNFDETGTSADSRTYLWATEKQGFSRTAVPYNKWGAGYGCIKFTALECEADGTMKRWQDPITGLNRAGKYEESEMKDSEGNPIEYNGQTLKICTVPNISKFHNTCVPVIRLAEIYLTAAEAILRGAGGDAAKYFNYIRTRAGVETIPSPTLNDILDERARELYWENNRRTDLIRFDRFTSNYNWTWKGGVEGGTVLPAHFNLYPLPSDVIATYGTSMKQNPNY